MNGAWRGFTLKDETLVKDSVVNIEITAAKVTILLGRAMAQAVSRQLLTAEAGFNPWSVYVGFVVDK
jgi:hypothetical protein